MRHDYFGRPLRVGDQIVWAGSRGSSGAHLTTGTVVDVDAVYGFTQAPAIIVKPKHGRKVHLTKFATVVRLGEYND